MKQPLITITIPIYNCEKYIERSIKSILDQTYTNIEILLIDDKSTDNSLRVINVIQLEHPDKIRIIELDKNQGPSNARNIGINNAKGEYLFFVDADDEIILESIEKLYNKATETRATLTIGKTMAKNTFKNTEYEIFPYSEGLEYLDNNTSILEYFCAGAWAVSPWNKLFKIDFLKKNNLYFIENILLAEDELWSFHIALKLDSIAFLDEYTYRYYLHGESTIFNKKKVHFESCLLVIEYFTKSYKQEPDRNRKRYILNHIVKFKELILIMLWRSMSEDVNYWKRNYTKLKKNPSLSIIDYFSSYYSRDVRKKNIFQNLPTEFGYRLFKWRFERK